MFVVKVVLASVGEENKPRPLECDQEPNHQQHLFELKYLFRRMFLLPITLVEEEIIGGFSTVTEILSVVVHPLFVDTVSS